MVLKLPGSWIGKEGPIDAFPRRVNDPVEQVDRSKTIGTAGDFGSVLHDRELQQLCL